MGRLGTERDEIPDHVGVLQVGLRIPLLCVDEGGEEEGVTDEEDGCVVADEVPVAVLSVVLHGEAARVTGRVRRPALPADGREADEHRRLLADLGEDLRLGELGHVVRHLRVSGSRKCAVTRAYSMNVHLRV